MLFAQRVSVSCPFVFATDEKCAYSSRKKPRQSLSIGGKIILKWIGRDDVLFNHVVQFGVVVSGFFQHSNELLDRKKGLEFVEELRENLLLSRDCQMICCEYSQLL